MNTWGLPFPSKQPSFTAPTDHSVFPFARAFACVLSTPHMIFLNLAATSIFLVSGHPGASGFGVLKPNIAVYRKSSHLF